MAQPLPRIFVERVTDIEPDISSGNVKLTYAVRSKNSNHEVVQLIMHINDLRRSFGEIWDVLQKAFAEARPAQPKTDTVTDITGG